MRFLKLMLIVASIMVAPTLLFSACTVSVAKNDVEVATPIQIPLKVQEHDPCQKSMISVPIKKEVAQARYGETRKVVPIGIRNNNPGNIIQTRIKWRGEVECASRFECFDTAEHGIRALGVNLMSYYYRHNLVTTNDIVYRWSPPNENNTDAVVKFYTNYNNVDKDEVLNFNNYEVFKKFVISIIINENGYNPYSSEEIDNAIRDIHISRVNSSSGAAKAMEHENTGDTGS
jgi:hypothetical protein